MANDQLKKFGLPLLLGVGVIILTPILAGFLNGIPLMATSIAGLLTVGTAVAAGVSAFVIDLALNKWLR